jgi:hypothetical protein
MSNQFTFVPWPERFWAKVDKTSGPIISKRLGRCWLWTGTTSGGYGMTRDQDGKMTTANRAAYVIEKGSISPDHDACHRCDITLCVRPSHLFAATSIQNFIDASCKGRCGGAKLSPHEVRDIRRRIKRGETHASIAVKFHVVESNISKIFTKVSWKWL